MIGGEMKFKVGEKIVASVAGLLLIGVGIFVFVATRTFFQDSTGWLFAIVGILVTIVVLGSVGGGIAAIAYVWITVPSQNKKDIELEEWLKTEGYELCDQTVRVVRKVSMEYQLNENGNLVKLVEDNQGTVIWIGPEENKESLTIFLDHAVPLLDVFSYIRVQKYLVLFFKQDPCKMYIYKQKAS
jgi:hypothetical protein